MAAGLDPGRSLENRMKLITAFGLAAAFIGTAFIAAPVSADEFTPAQKQELGAFIKSYLVSNPEVLRDAIEALDKHDKETADAERQKVVATQSSALFSSKYQATVGNPQGTATLVEFFDYNCHFCKGALPDVTKLPQKVLNKDEQQGKVNEMIAKGQNHQSDAAKEIENGK